MWGCMWSFKAAPHVVPWSIYGISRLDGRGQCLVPWEFSLPVLLAVLCGFPPSGICTCSSCPACASIFLARANWKSLYEIFFPSHGERKMEWFRIARFNRWKKNIFFHLYVWWLMEYLLAILVPYPSNPCDGFICHSEWFCCVPPYIAEIILLVRNGCSSICEFVSCSSTVLLSCHPLSLNVTVF